MSKKAKGIILIILLVLCLGGIVLEIKLLYPKYIKKNPSTSNNKQQIDDKNNNNQNDKQNTNGDEKNKENNINVYDRYSDMKWAGTSLKPYDKDESEVKIDGGKLECSGFFTVLCNLTSSINEPIKKISFDTFYASQSNVYLLTESGKIYEIKNYFFGQDTSNEKSEIKQIMTNYTIIDMTEQYINYSHPVHQGDCDLMWLEGHSKNVYFLTKDGKLISKDENTYETDNRDFVRSTCFSYGNRASFLLCLFYNKENHVSYRWEKYDHTINPNYIDLKNKSGEDFIAKYVYDIYGDEGCSKVLITDENEDLYAFEYINDELTINYLGKVISVTFNKEKMLTFTLLDGNKYQVKSMQTDYFDVASKKAVPFNSN